MGKEEAKQKVAELVALYQGLSRSQLREYNEARTKQGFIQPLFRHLGWNFDDTEEVAPEEKASKGRVDYAFKLRGVAHFYLEAKPLKADLNTPEYAQQAVTYAYNKGVAWAVLTDFEGLRVFNAQTGGPFLNLTCQDYLSDFDRLWLLSRDSVESGALNREAAKVGAVPPPQPVERRLYALLRQWREELYTQLHLHNPQLSFERIDEVIQRLFNRLFFIRTCEDQGIEERVLLAALNRWQASGRKGEFITELREIFRQFDGYYDSDLFMLHPLDQAFIEAPTTERIISGLYEVPGGLARYDFSVLDADVLGAVYEQYLGYVATIVRQRAKEAQARLSLGLPAETIALEAKRQKRKEQGIYYTPRWVTDYIVKQTVGRFIAERSHDEILNIKVLDPACGSGSFLIGAYAELLSYHAGVRSKTATELDQWERLPILTGNIFGVDLDRQAVEIACLNLLLRSLAKRETLPSLAENIRQGNSLISGGEKELKPYFGDAWREKSPFNWEEKFPQIMRAGGFDVIIGNPPYLFGENLLPSEKEYCRTCYEVAKGQYDAFWLFYERSLGLLKEGGYHGYIIPDAILARDEVAILRKLLLTNAEIIGIAHVGLAFQQSGVSAVIIILRKAKKPASANFVFIEERSDTGVFTLKGQIMQRGFLEQNRQAFILDLAFGWGEVKRKLMANCCCLGDIARLSRGEELGKKNLAKVKGTVAKGKVPILAGEDVARFAIYEPQHVVAKTDIAKAKDNYESPKILIVKTGRRLVCSLDPNSRYTLQSLYNLQLNPNSPLSYNYILGILNSKTMSAWIQREVTAYKRLFPQINQNHILSLPMRCIDFDNPADKKLHDEIVALVEAMLQLNRRLTEVPEWEEEKRQEIERESRRTDEKIDGLVYDLYGLTEEERKIVEGGAA